MAYFELVEKMAPNAVIKVVGVGGGGGNAVAHMVNGCIEGVEFITANTDSQAIKNCGAKLQLQLGGNVTKGLGAGANPEVGRQAALEDRERIMDALQGADMVFITAGMGGGTGTGAAPIVAEVARELGILTVAVVTKPFAFEGKRMKIAEAGIAELQQHVDSLIVILNDRLMDVLGDDACVDECFRAADDVLRNAVGGIAEIITYPGLVNVDFEDVRTVMGEMGMAMMGSAAAAGVDRARIAAEKAVASPLLEGVNLTGARGVLVDITASRNLKMKEVNEVMSTVKAFAADDAHIIFGAVYEDGMEDELRVTVVATGLGRGSNSGRKPLEVINSMAYGSQRTGTYDQGASGAAGAIDYDRPAVFRNPRAAAQVDAMTSSGVDPYEIPAFLRKQAD